MYPVEAREMTAEFFECWKAALIHLDSMLKKRCSGHDISWQRVHPNPPFQDHLSFRYLNQLFFVRVIDVARKIEGPGSIQGLFRISDECKGHSCIMLMAKTSDGIWKPAQNHWGIIDARSGSSIDPADMVTNEKIEMTRWETQDFAVQIVKRSLEEHGHKILSWAGDPEINPSIWYVGKSGKMEWVLVKHTKYPIKTAPRPDNWQSLLEQLSMPGTLGHFASVSLVNAEQSFGPSDPIIPLWRGCGCYASYAGLDAV